MPLPVFGGELPETFQQSVAQRFKQTTDLAIVIIATEVRLHAENWECYGTGVRKALQCRQRIVEESNRELYLTWVLPPTSHYAQCPHCAPMRIFGPNALQPLTLVGHETSKPAGLLIESIVQETQVGRR